MNLDPNIREKLLQESRNPFRGIRRVLWLALSASAGIGLLIMGIRSFAGENVLKNDLIIQITAFVLFASLVLIDRSKND
ncbi:MULTISPECIES: DUF3493 domain-containing protein [Prochlorococcus]|uniref:Uncharacterized membrane protein n=1 Tax=Prochlorococcus marinus (strain SARG / CCMP1375 / SS120) TaxID=167539 RepID=Q7VA19_PROMA|nr:MULTISPECIES: DUF3493 domain-containing protein [Prochlorococcus]AAQ00694.1 Uncharacterized membrane protein [Prochlorococcus marinus subsp. marinus str. CCMP1375]KGG10810.1 hypothetical protein EV04_1771 [Prochlorococcus marinus str. LG]KGG20388.1 hypothetical protein EV08_0971 [Prochlorococcus marinus str. SS2]KGG24057.1 hypothetical protein EV09_0661 [Prochlorococcus marinus str. SS35]KGG31684.1 hypothetical protein EV10_1781 [Prochlorococcus marinus str. SS51]